MYKLMEIVEIFYKANININKKISFKWNNTIKT